MVLTRHQVTTLARLIGDDRAMGVRLCERRGEILIEWTDAVGISAQMALRDDGKIVLPSKRRRFHRGKM